MEKRKIMYAFGDSIVYGHEYFKKSFVNYVGEQFDFAVEKFAVNGATIVDAGYEGGQILKQIHKAPKQTPDLIIFDGGTNDAEYIGQGGCGYEQFEQCFRQTVETIKNTWQDVPVIYVSAHKMGSRKMEIQEQLRKTALFICKEYNVWVADVYKDAPFDTNDREQKNRYTFDTLDENGLPGNGGSGTHPNLEAIEKFYVPVVADTLKKMIK